MSDNPLPRSVLYHVFTNVHDVPGDVLRFESAYLATAHGAEGCEQDRKLHLSATHIVDQALDVIIDGDVVVIPLFLRE